MKFLVLTNSWLIFVTRFKMTINYVKKLIIRLNKMEDVRTQVLKKVEASRFHSACQSVGNMICARYLSLRIHGRNCQIRSMILHLVI